MKLTEEQPFANPEAAARKLLGRYWLEIKRRTRF
jgi:hypothetical protein